MLMFLTTSVVTVKKNVLLSHNLHIIGEQLGLGKGGLSPFILLLVESSKFPPTLPSQTPTTVLPPSYCHKARNTYEGFILLSND